MVFMDKPNQMKFLFADIHNFTGFTCEQFQEQCLFTDIKPQNALLLDL